MPTIIVTNPLRALQLENQRLRRENETLRQQLAANGGSRELGRETPNAVQSAQSLEPLPVQPTRVDRTARPPTATRLPVASAPRPMVYVMAAESAAPTAPRPSRVEAPVVSVARRMTHSEIEALDDAAMRFQLLELD
jgi:cell division septum initiation protein DivIVA